MILTHGANSLSRGSGDFFYRTDFQNFTLPTFKPDIGPTMNIGNAPSGFYYDVTPTGLYFKINSSLSGVEYDFDISQFSGKKVLFHEKKTGIYESSSPGWQIVGFGCGVFSNSYTPSRGAGTWICQWQVDIGTIQSGFNIDWGWPESPFGTSYLLKPDTAIYPIAGKEVVSECIIDFVNNGFELYINGVKAFECTGMEQTKFEHIAQIYARFGIYGGDSSEWTLNEQFIQFI